MKLQNILGAFLAVIIGTGTAIITAITGEGVVTLADISQIQWLVIGVGAVIAFAKDLQALATRTFIGKMTGTGG